MEYFIRDFNDNTTLEGPFSFTHADRSARDLSAQNLSGLAELLVRENENAELMVMATYLRGKKRYQGLRSRQASLYNLPPTL